MKSIKTATNTILPPPPDEAVESVNFPKEQTLPQIEDPDLEKMEESMFIYEKDKPLMDALLKKKKEQQAKRDFEAARREMDEVIQGRLKDNPTIVHPKPEEAATFVEDKKANYTSEQLIKLCHEFASLAAKL